MTIFGTNNENKFEQPRPAPEVQRSREVAYGRSYEVSEGLKLAFSTITYREATQGLIDTEMVDNAIHGQQTPDLQEVDATHLAELKARVDALTDTHEFNLPA